MNYKNHIIGEMLFDEPQSTGPTQPTYVITGLLATKGIGSYDITISAGSYMIDGVTYQFQGLPVYLLTEGNTMIWVDSTGIQQGTTLPAGAVLLAEVTTDGTQVTRVDVSSVYSFYQVCQDNTSILSHNTGVSKNNQTVSYLTHNNLVDNDSLKTSIESLDTVIGSGFTGVNSISHSISSINTTLSDLGSTSIGKGASLLGINDIGGLITAVTVEGAVEEIANNLRLHQLSTSTHGVMGSIVGTTDSQTLTNKTLVVPGIVSFVNAQHSHQTSQGGGTLVSNAITDFAQASQDSIGTVLMNTNSVSLNYSGTLHQISASVIPAGVDHNQLLNFEALRHLRPVDISLDTLGIRNHSMLTNIGPDDHHAQHHNINTHDTTATGAQLTTLTGGGNADSLHTHTVVGIPTFVEAAQDAVGNALQSTTSVQFIYNDFANTIIANVKPTGVDHNQLLNYDSNRHLLPSEINLSQLATKNHSDLQNISPDDHHAQHHTIGSHTDTTASGTQLNTLTNGSSADLLHTHTVNSIAGMTTSIQDTVGSMVSGNTETDISVSYDGTGKKLNFVIQDHFLRNDIDTSTIHKVTANALEAKSFIIEENMGVGRITLQSPSGYSSYSLTLPISDGNPSQLLSTDGSGVLSWATPFNPASPGALGGTTPAAVDGTIITAHNSVVLDGSTSGTVTLQATAVTTPYSIKLPASQGASGEYMANDGSGNLVWHSMSEFVSDSVLQAAGDLITRNASNITTRLAIGARGTVLKSQGTGQAPVWQATMVRNVYANGAVRIIADRDGLGAVKTVGNCTITNTVGAKISRVEVDVNQISNHDFDGSGNFTVTFSPDIGSWSYPIVSVIDRSNVTVDPSDPTDATPFIQYMCSEDSTSGLRARIIGTNKVKIFGLGNTVDFGTLVIQF
jgi:hypothetical protein